jgi:hypothetical protein
MAPTIGATRNSQTWLSAWPPTTTAGPRLRAGLTEAPSKGMPIMFTRASPPPYTAAVSAALKCLLVALSTTSTNTAVRMISIRNAPPPEIRNGDSVPQPLAPRPFRDTL